MQNSNGLAGPIQRTVVSAKLLSANVGLVSAKLFSAKLLSANDPRVSAK
jgi:hypothetical protein